MAEHTRIVNLTFHGVGSCERPMEPGEERVWVTLERFPVLVDAIAELKGGGVTLGITVDDGNQSDLRVAAPAFAAAGITGTFFVCAGRLGMKGFLDASGVRALQSMGMRIGSHGHSHVSWRGLSSDKARQEFAEARARLEEIVGTRVEEAACPFGEYDRRSLSRLREAGFKVVYTSDGGGADSAAWLQARTSIAKDDDAASLARIVRDASRRSVVREVKTLLKRAR
jgi:peptidoglycan/xylan/chitin deacetylase (PgdA/CDA1 family)